MSDKKNIFDPSKKGKLRKYTDQYFFKNHKKNLVFQKKLREGDN